MIEDYIVIHTIHTTHEEDMEEFIDLVADFLEDGYVPYGAPFVRLGEIYQFMVKYK